MILALVSGLFWQRDIYYDYEGDRFTTISVDLWFTKLHFQDEKYEFGQYFSSFYQGHFAGGYMLESFMHPWLGDAALPITIFAFAGWELGEHYILRTCPVSLMDIAWASLGAYISDAHFRGNMSEWGFRYQWMILDNPLLIKGTRVSDIYRGQEDLPLLLWCIIPGNYNPYTFGIYRVGEGSYFEIGFTYVPLWSRFHPEIPPEGWGVLVWDTHRGVGVGSEKLFFPPDTLLDIAYNCGPSWFVHERFCPYFKLSFSF